MGIKPRSRGIQRISESEQIRDHTQKTSTIKLGKTCVGCKSYYSYLRPEEKLCLTCNARRNSLGK